MSALPLPTRLVAGELEPCRAALKAALAGEGELVLDAAELAALDTAGLQLLLAARLSAAARGRALRLTGCRPELAGLLRLAGAEGLLGLGAEGARG